MYVRSNFFAPCWRKKIAVRLGLLLTQSEQLLFCAIFKIQSLRIFCTQYLPTAFTPTSAVCWRLNLKFFFHQIVANLRSATGTLRILKTIKLWVFYWKNRSFFFRKKTWNFSKSLNLAIFWMLFNLYYFSRMSFYIFAFFLAGYQKKIKVGKIWWRNGVFF